MSKKIASDTVIEGSLSVDGDLELNTHQIHGLVDGVDGKDAATVDQLYSLGMGPNPIPATDVPTYSNPSGAVGTSVNYAREDHKHPGGVFNVKDYGAIGNGSTDDTTAIQSALTAAATLGHSVLVPIGTFKITDTITVPNNVSLICDGVVNFNRTGTDRPAIIMAGTRSSDRLSRINVVNVSSDAYSWSSESSIGVRIDSAQDSKIEIEQAYGFTIGVQIKSSGASGGNVYNEYTLGSLVDNKIGLDIIAVSGGWVNENLFLGGHFSTSTGVNPTISRHGIRMGADTYPPDGNKFIKPSFEIGTSTVPPAEVISILINAGTSNTFEACRNETAGENDTFVRTTGSLSRENFVSLAYDNQNYETIHQDLGPWRRTSIESMGLLPLVKSVHNVFSIEDIHKKAVTVLSGTNIHVPGMIFGDSSTGNQLNYYDVGASYATLTADYLQLHAQDIGVLVDTRLVKRFTLAAGTEPGYGGRLIVRGYDASMTIINPLTADPPLVDSGLTTAVSGYGGASVTGTDTDYAISFTLSDEVKFAWIGRMAGTNKLRIKSFRLTTDDPRYVPAAWSPFMPMTVPVIKQTVTGAKAGNAALADLITKLATLGLITDSTS